MRNATKMRCVAGTVMATGMFAGAAPPAQTYWFEDLGVTTGVMSASIPHLAQINNAGLVVVNDPAGAFLVAPGGTARTALGTPAGTTQPVIRDINNAGISVGWVTTLTQPARFQACAWLADGTPVFLAPLLPGFPNAVNGVHAINDSLGMLIQTPGGGSFFADFGSFPAPPTILSLIGTTNSSLPMRLTNSFVARANLASATNPGPAELVAPRNWTDLNPPTSTNGQMFGTSEAGVSVGRMTTTLLPTIFTPNATTQLPLPGGVGSGRFNAAGPRESAGGQYSTTIGGPLRALYLMPVYTGPNPVDVNSRVRFVTGTAPNGVINTIQDMAGDIAPVTVPVGQFPQAVWVGTWTPTGSSQQRIFRARQCITDFDLDGTPGTAADLAAFLACFFSVACGARIDIDGDSIFPDQADLALFIDLIATDQGC